MNSQTNNPARVSGQAEDYDYTIDHTGEYHAGNYQQHGNGSNRHAGATTTPQPVYEQVACWICGACGSVNLCATTPSCIGIRADGWPCNHAYCDYDCVVEWRWVEVEGTGSRNSGSSRGAGAGASGSSSSKKGPTGGSSSRSGGSSSRSGGVRSSRTARA